jgi:threonine dehydrogenase-like Zn-dependent dehydrogenase
VTAACICGPEPWPDRGVEEVNGPSPIGHEYVGIVEEIGDEVSMRPTRVRRLPSLVTARSVSSRPVE